MYLNVAFKDRKCIDGYVDMDYGFQGSDCKKIIPFRLQHCLKPNDGKGRAIVRNIYPIFYDVFNVSPPTCY